MIYLKLFLILIFIIIIIFLLKNNNIQETFNEDNQIIYTISKNGEKSVYLNWIKTNLNINKYLIIMFIDDDGPFINIKEVSNNNTNISYIINDIKLNSIYKISIQSINNITDKMSPLNIKEFMINSYESDLQIDNKNNFENNIVCSPDGQHYGIDTCPSNINYVQASDNLTTNNFDESNYNILMNNLNKRNSINLSLKKDSNFKYNLSLNK